MFKLAKLLKPIFGRARFQKPDSQTLDFINAAFKEMLEQHQVHAAQWIYGKEKGWSADLEAGIIVFQFANHVIGSCQFQTIGTYSERDQSFMWGWAHRQLPRALKIHAKICKQWGKDRGLAQFTRKRVRCNMEEAWNFAALTRKLVGAQSVYRGRVGDKYIFMTTGEMQISTTPSSTTPSNSPASAPTHWSRGRIQTKW